MATALRGHAAGQTWPRKAVAMAPNPNFMNDIAFAALSPFAEPKGDNEKWTSIMANNSALAPTAARAQSAESLMAQVADEYLERLERGERPDVEDYVQRHPQIATFL